MKVLVIEDEAAAFDNMKNLLHRIDPSIEIIDNFDTVAASVAWLRTHPFPDLIFMDIQLADGSSFHIFECVTVDTPVIFTTAYDEYAIRAFRVNSIDYLLKPITLDSLREALSKFEKVNLFTLRQKSRDMEQLLRPKDYVQRLLIPVKDKIIPVKTHDIAYIYNTGGSTEIVTPGTPPFTLDKSLDALMARLDPAHFFRANRQFIIPKERIASITIWFDNRLLVRLQTETPEPIYISKNRASEFKRWYSE